METADMIVLDEFCTSHQVEISFVRSLEEHGLIETMIVNETLCVPAMNYQNWNRSLDFTRN